MDDTLPGYAYGDPSLPPSPVTIEELARLKQAVGLDDEDMAALRRAGRILSPRADVVVDSWRQAVAAVPHLLAAYASAEGVIDDRYRVRVRERFKRWIDDLCFRPWDQPWLDYQHEIGARHTHLAKNKADAAAAVGHIPLRYLIAFTAVVNDRVKPFLVESGAAAEEVEAMHRAWCKAALLSVTLWTRPYVADSAW
ncbi:MAG: protogloblin ApPgb [Alphaproteobacteria bacterium]|nr:protogloblin ApPgb [Alphaproteobacteria bacterium]